MKKWYYKLKECQKYNVLILAVLMALVIKFAHYIYVTAVNVYQVVAWDMLDVYGFAMIGSAALTVLFIVLAIAFVIQAVKREPKMMIGAIVSLAVVAVTGVSFGAVICMIACGYWLWMVTRAHEKTFMQYIKWAIAIVTVLIIGLELIGGIVSMGYWSEWGPEASMEEGDWSGWSTLDENGNVVRMEEDENGNIIYYDE